MEQVRIQTSQNVDIEYEVAGVGDRVLATLLDILILFAYSIFVLISLPFIGRFLEGQLWMSIIMSLPYLFYDLVSEIFMNGQTIGKRARKIKVLKVDGSQPTVGAYLMRWIFKIFEVYMTFGSVGLITILISSKGQRLGDMAAGTTLVKLKKRTDLSETIFTKVAEDYIPKYQQANLLDNKTIETIKEVLDVRIDEDRHNTKKLKLIAEMKKVVEKKMNLQVDADPVAFLQIVLKDYNYFKGKI